MDLVRGVWTPQAATFHKICMSKRKNQVPWGGTHRVRPPKSANADQSCIKTSQLLQTSNLSNKFMDWYLHAYRTPRNRTTFAVHLYKYKINFEKHLLSSLLSKMRTHPTAIRSGPAHDWHYFYDQRVDFWPWNVTWCCFHPQPHLGIEPNGMSGNTFTTTKP